MSTTDVAAIVPAIREAAETDAIWFLGTLSMIKASRESTDGHMAVVEMLAPPGFGTPLHVHRREDEWFYVIEGALTVWVDGEASELPADPSHTGLVTFRTPSSSARPPRSVPPRRPAVRLRGVRPGARRARQALTLAPASVELPSPQRMATVAARYGMEILGPPGIPV